MGENIDGGASQGCADFKTSTVVRQNIWPGAVNKIDRHQELNGWRSAVIHVADLRKIKLRAVLDVTILNDVSKGICGACKFPGKNMVRMVRINNHGRSGCCLCRPSTVGALQSVFRFDLSKIAGLPRIMNGPRKKAFRPR